MTVERDAPLPNLKPEGTRRGPAAGLALADTLTDEPSLKAYHLLPGVRGDFLRKLGRFDEARAEFERSAALTRNTRERELLLARAADCRRPEAAPTDDASIAAVFPPMPKRE